uniref:Tetratricopeptide repeat-containing protein n=1 Tax=Candidatus Kentrum sp. SD TaxID=2126332 RepID=A0A450YD64_9GAMM|nr:MAG: hypothetical protein BECKSD772F_GA0070984_104020 [Candidatus Kentron sp. SD]VFK44596.1 MAG: hypothetical protein BECKSD772E_GA0070983_104020 [Candidatus Kentron sp. SD]
MQENQFQQISQRAERLFAKKSYAAARKEFERILALSPDEEVREKIRICDGELRLLRRGDRIKKGRRLEKKGDLAGALDCFTEADAARAEPWLRDKVAQLRQRLEAARIASTVEEVGREEDPEKRLAAYDLALANGADPDLLEKKAGCLVEMGRYGEAIDAYGDRPPRTAQGRYDFGYALIATGGYLQGLTQWAPLLAEHPVLFPQVMTFLPCLARELAARGEGYALPYGILSNPEIFGSETRAPEAAASLEEYRRYFRYCYLKECWRAEDYAGIPELLPSPPRLRDTPLLARLYLNLARTDVDYLKVAITYWLTVIHDRRLPNAPRADGIASADPTARDPSSDDLLAPLAELVANHEQAGRVTPALKAHWRAERRHVEALAAFFDGTDTEPSTIGREGDGAADDAADGEQGGCFPCTPAFAREFGLSEGILRLLRTKKDHPNTDERTRLELHAGYSPQGEYMDWIESGREEKIFKALPSAKAPDPEAEYLRQRIALRCGMNRVRAGGRQTRKFFQAALPILETAQDLPQELIDLAYSEPSKKVISSLSEAMEFLAKYLKEPRFLEAAAHCIGMEVENLLLEEVSVNILEKRLNQGLAIYPDCEQIQASRSLVLKEKNALKVEKALRSGNLDKAARAVRDSEDSEMENMFFEAMESFYDQAIGECEENEIGPILNRIYNACRIVDEEEQHWLTEQLAGDRIIRGTA